jgi:hypothetical protein
VKVRTLVRVRFMEYGASAAVPNVVVDGSPNEATVLLLTHWPGYPQPDGMAADLSAQMAFRYVRSGRDVGADVVTNNHLDQDGLVSMLAFVETDAALAHEDVLTDVAAAGDFATYRFRSAARACMAIAAYADPGSSPIGDQLRGPYEEQCAALYETLLPLVVSMVLDPSPWRSLWESEDAHLAASEAAIAAADVTIEEIADVDLAVVRTALEPGRARRFASNEHTGVHPMAVHNATSCVRLLDVHGRTYRYTDRYETWVQYRSRELLPRRDLRPLADELSSLDRGGAWSAAAPGSLTPELRGPDDSALDEATVLAALTRHLRESPPAWHPS